MKKFLFSTMIASLLAFVGCQNEEPVNDNNTPNGGEKVILTANIQGSAQTRLALTAGTDSNDKPIVKVAWREYDENNPETFLVDGANDVYKFTQVSDTEFSGTLPEPYSDGSYEALYNLDLWSNFGGNKDYTFEQDGTLREQDMMMIASFNKGDTSIEFQHMMSILKPTFRVGEDIVNNTITHIEMGVIVACSTTVVIDVKPTAPATILQNDIYLTIPTIEFPYMPSNFKPGETFNFAVTADGKDYIGSLTIPDIDNWEPEGKLFTATIGLTEVCNLPNGTTFKMAILNVLPDDKSVQAIKFVAGSSADDTSAFDPNYNWKMPANAKYKIIDTTPKTLEIHTTAEVFMFNTSCYRMFDANISTPNELAEITTIDFGDCINTSNVTSMKDMFQACEKLTSLDLSSFKFKNDVTVTDMFFYTGRSSGGTTKIIVDEDGYNYLKDKDTDISSSYAQYVKPDGVTPWETSTP